MSLRAPWRPWAAALGLFVAVTFLGAPKGRAESAEPGHETQLLAHIETLDRKLVRAEAALIEGDAQVRAIAHDLSAAESARAAADGAYQQAVAKLGRRLGALTRMGPNAQLTALTGVRDLSQLIDEQQLMGAIAKHDRQLWAARQATRQQLDDTIALAQERAQALDAAQGQRRAARDALARSRQRKDRTLQAMRKRRKRQALGTELQLAQVHLAQVVAQAPAVTDGAGSDGATPLQPSRARVGLPWPASGRVRIGYGQHTEHTFGTATFHNGWDIAAAAGSQVTAVAAGVVAYAEWLHGYGQVAIVEHPGGYHTVHGHLSRLHVSRGQRVRAGQLLGAVGDTGSLRGTVLYFEIRHRGVPQDPRLYLSRR